jgi:alpha-galactosidase
VLDLGHRGTYEHVYESLDALLNEYHIAYLKWDHNRYLNDAGHTPHDEAGVHDHTAAAYRLMDELRAAHPGLEIESCAGGGGRVDLGVIERTDRVWARAQLPAAANGASAGQLINTVGRPGSATE